MQLSAPLIVAAVLLAYVAVGHALIRERGECLQRIIFKENRRLKVNSHVFEERFILGSRFGDHTSIVRSPYPRLRFYSFCARRSCRRLFLPSCQYFTLPSVSLINTIVARFNYFSLFLPPKDLNLQRASNTLFLVLVVSAAETAGAFFIHVDGMCEKRDSFRRAALANIATFRLRDKKT